MRRFGPGLLAAGLFAGTAAPATAFYFPNWPGARTAVAPAIITSEVFRPGDPPSVRNPQPVEPLHVPPDQPPETHATPEPTALIAAGLGLLTLAAGRVRRVRTLANG